MDILAMVRFLVSPAGQNISGQALSMCGDSVCGYAERVG